MTPISFFAWSHQRSHHKKAQKRHPHHHRNHVVSTSTAAAALSSAKVLMSHGNTALPRHAPGLHYHANLMASAITSSSAAITRPGTRLPSPTTAQRAKIEARQLAPLRLNWWRFAQHILSLRRPRILLYLQIELVCYYLQKNINTSRCDYNN